jgi:hypothetical protein
MCMSLLRCTPAIAERDESAVGRVPAALQRWIARASEAGRPVVRPLQALRAVAGVL